MNVLMAMAAVATLVLTLLGLTTVNAIVDMYYKLTSTIVQVNLFVNLLCM